MSAIIDLNSFLKKFDNECLLGNSKYINKQLKHSAIDSFFVNSIIINHARKNNVKCVQILIGSNKVAYSTIIRLFNIAQSNLYYDMLNIILQSEKMTDYIIDMYLIRVILYFTDEKMLDVAFKYDHIFKKIVYHFLQFRTSDDVELAIKRKLNLSKTDDLKKAIQLL